MRIRRRTANMPDWTWATGERAQDLIAGRLTIEDNEIELRVRAMRHAPPGMGAG